MNTLADKLPKSLNLSEVNLIKLNRVFPPVFTIILIIACSYTLSQITWLLVPGEEEQSAPRNFKSGNAKKLQNRNYNEITNAHLFGVFQKSTSKPTQTIAPETRLNLVLKGVLATKPMEYGNAIIAMGKNGKEETYSIGDKVSSATVKEIYADRVILERSGKLETLRMPKDKSDNLIKSAPQSSTRQSKPATGPGAVLSDIRKQILKNPTSFGKYAIPVPVNKNGRTVGYRLQPQGDRSLFDAVGLDPDDVIIAVNGVELNNPTKGLKALRSLQRAKSIDLTVLRNGAELPLHFDIP
ncbi:MAG: type II secretion system protein GspC [endosymbiont of Galathealinum brachiosum]|uniref:Type II secretion system protein GspC n=1 Tax=endosymbiont of Galathealinum brachiosum TaxID=2200906 RepID=A0A370DD86_9GAMM|nr:MAG: type II secretion system protein GspC [endosymbiont of Galathealinum brachiosum]